MNRQFPCLEVYLDRLYHNARQVISRCAAQGIRVCGVIKGVEGMPAVARVMQRAGAAQIGTSRLEQVARCRAAGVEEPFMLIRIPALTELADTVALCEMSLQSERATLDALEQECRRQGKTHAVVVMADLGDLREGFWSEDELVEVCCHVERSLPHVHLAGIGVNLSCYGAIQPTPEKMTRLTALADRVEQAIGRRLEIVSGGATSSYTLVHWHTMPPGINHLRIGENILLGYDLQRLWHIEDMDYLRMDTFILRAEVVEVREKPSYPQGQFCIDAFGHTPEYEDRGIRRRALLALGRADVGELESLEPCAAGITVVGGSSDHCILDVTDCPEPLRVGGTVSFRLRYGHLLYLSGRDDVRIALLGEKTINQGEEQ